MGNRHKLGGTCGKSQMPKGFPPNDTRYSGLTPSTFIGGYVTLTGENLMCLFHDKLLSRDLHEIGHAPGCVNDDQVKL
jgi:hypothetical protein